MENLREYLKRTIGIEPDIKVFNPEKLKSLPLFIRKEYEIYQIHFYQNDYLLIKINNEFTIAKLQKHIKIIEDILQKKIIAVFNKLESYHRLRMIEKKIPFIIPDRQMYLPELLIDLKEFRIKKEENTSNKMTPATQFLILYHLQKESLEGMNLKNIAELLGYNSATITRSLQYLKKKELCTVEGKKEKFLYFHHNKREIWDKAKPFMINPVKKTYFYEGNIKDKGLCRANINALSKYTDINDEPVDYYAVRQGLQSIINENNLEITPDNEGNICIEEWKYDGCKLTNNNFVDILSLYLALKEIKNERIEKALDKLINRIKW